MSFLLSVDSTIKWLKEHNLLRKECRCPGSEKLCSWMWDSLKVDLYFWQCLQCMKKVSILHGSFFERSRLSLRVLLAIVNLSAFKLPLQLCMKPLNGLVSQRVLIDWFNFCREVMSMRLWREPIQLGGIGNIIEIDESKFGKKRKYNHGKNAESRLLGLWCRIARHK